MNTEAVLFILTGVCLCVCLVRITLRRSQSYAKYIMPELGRAGLTVLDINTPRVFDVGPFRKIEVKIGGCQSTTPIGSGEYTEYRIVNAKTPAGRLVEVWCKLEFELFRFKSIDIKINEN